MAATTNKYLVMWVHGSAQGAAGNLQITLNSQTALGARVHGIYPSTDPAHPGFVVVFENA
jgi:hypothetical protein